MRHFIGMGLIALVLAWVACDSSPLVKTVHGAFDLEYGESVFVSGPDLTVTFTGEVYESRCCLTCYCFWPGYATIELDLSRGGSTRRIVLSTPVYGGATPPAWVDTLGYRFQLINLSPYPEEMVRYSNEDYVATLDVSPIPNDSTGTEVIITDDSPATIPVHPFSFDSAIVVGDKLRLSIHHGGGCEPHYYQLYMTPASFIDATPKQAYLYLRHFGPPDYCDALIHTTVEFDLGPIIDLYYSTVSGGGGEVALMMPDCFDVVVTDPPCTLFWEGTLQVPSLPD